MKNSEYFNLRDDLLIEAIRSDLTHEELEDVITNFSFEAIASRSKFRDNYGPVYLVILLLETSNVGIQLSILNKIQNEVCINDDNKKQLKKVIDSKAIVEFLSHTSLG